MRVYVDEYVAGECPQCRQQFRIRASRLRPVPEPAIWCSGWRLAGASLITFAVLLFGSLLIMGLMI